MTSISERELRAHFGSRPSPSEIRARIEGRNDDRRAAQNRARCPVAVAAEELVNETLMLRALPDAARVHLEEQSATLSDLIRRGRDITSESATVLYEYIATMTGLTA